MTREYRGRIVHSHIGERVIRAVISSEREMELHRVAKKLGWPDGAQFKLVCQWWCHNALGEWHARTETTYHASQDAMSAYILGGCLHMGCGHIHRRAETVVNGSVVSFNIDL